MEAQISEGQHEENANEDARDASEQSIKFSLNATGLVGSRLLNGDTLEAVDIGKMEGDRDSVLFNTGKQAHGGRNEDSGEKLVSDLGIKLAAHGARYSAVYPVYTQGTELAKFSYNGTEGVEMSSDMDAQNLGGLSNDFANTFMLDEELELEHKMLKNDGLSPVRRYRILMHT